MTKYRLAAIKIERRSIAVAIFTDSHLEYTQVRQLASAPEKAEASAIGFINWLLATFEIQSAVLEKLANSSLVQRAILHNAVVDTLRNNSISVWEVDKQELFAACAFPAAKNRKEVRDVMGAIWPILKSPTHNASVIDAFALGLFVQTKRLFII